MKRQQGKVYQFSYFLTNQSFTLLKADLQKFIKSVYTNSYIYTVGQKIEKGPKKIIKSAIEKTREIEIL